ncbi:MAG TPA: LacI family DNA-binding transcriptional regulator [Fimbriimonas sp.]
MSPKGRQRTGAITLREIAEEVGVSTAAVSKVLHGRGGNVRVSDATAVAIRDAAQRLRYTPNALARSLRMNRTFTVGLVFENFGEIAAGPLYYVHMLDGVASELFRNHYRLTILSEIDHGRAVETVCDGRLDGLIWCKMPEQAEVQQAVMSGKIPCVALNVPPPKESLGIVYVSCDNEGGSRLVADHLVGLGHRRIAFVLEKGEESTPDARARLAGFRTHLAAHGIDLLEEDVITFSNTAAEFRSWSAARTGHTALYAWNERMAAEILHRSHECGVRVPQELSVVGFDSTQFCETTIPRLTAVRQPIKPMAQEAARILLDLIEGCAPSTYSSRFPCVLDVRDSTAVASAAGIR